MHAHVLTSIALYSLLSCVSAYGSDQAGQEPLIQVEKHHDEHEPGADNPLDLTQSAYMGLTTYANIPYVHCLANEDMNEDYKGEKYDIAV